MKNEGDALEALPDPFLPIQRSSHLRHALILHCNPSQAIALASGAAVAMFPTVSQPLHNRALGVSAFAAFGPTGKCRNFQKYFQKKVCERDF